MKKGNVKKRVIKKDTTTKNNSVSNEGVNKSNEVVKQSNEIVKQSNEIVKQSISQDVKKISVLFYVWVNIPHSYAIVNCFQLVHLYKLYGPNGRKGHRMNFYITEAPYYNPAWTNAKQLVYSEEYNEIIRNLPIHNGEPVDIIYRQTYPYNINVTEEDKDIPKCVFYTSEFAQLNHTYFTVEKPDDLPAERYDEYISVFLHQFDNIHFTAPSNWSARGLIKFLSNKEEHERNRMITHGVDSTIFYKKYDNTRRKVRAMYNVKEGDILMMNIGAMTTNKGILLIIEALHNMVNKLKRPQYKLLLKGSGDLYACQQFLESYFIRFKQVGIMSDEDIQNLYKHIIFTNKTLSYGQINDLFNAADLYISPYLAEGFGLTMLEALAAGLHVLVPQTGSTKEYIEDIYNNGGEPFITYVDSLITVDSMGMCQNSIPMNNLMSSLLNNESKIKSKKSRLSYITMKKYIETNYSWYKVAELLYTYLDDIVEKRI